MVRTTKGEAAVISRPKKKSLCVRQEWFTRRQTIRLYETYAMRTKWLHLSDNEGRHMVTGTG